MRLRLLLLAVVLVLSGCTTATPVSKTVGSVSLVSAMGDRLRLVQQSLPFNGETTDAVVDWKIDERIRRILADNLRRRYTINELNYPLPYIVDVAWNKTLDGQAKRIGDIVSAALKTIVPPGTADAIVYIAPATTRLKNYTGRAALTATRLQGLGLSTRTSILGSMFEGPPEVFTSYRIMVFDGRTFDLLGQATGAEPHTRYLTWKWRGGIYDDIPQDHRREMETVLFEMLAESIPATLAALGMLD
jgi:hypothetical protein